MGFYGPWFGHQRPRPYYNRPWFYGPRRRSRYYKGYHQFWGPWY